LFGKQVTSNKRTAMFPSDLTWFCLTTRIFNCSTSNYWKVVWHGTEKTSACIPTKAGHHSFRHSFNAVILKPVICNHADAQMYS